MTTIKDNAKGSTSIFPRRHYIKYIIAAIGTLSIIGISIISDYIRKFATSKETYNLHCQCQQLYRIYQHQLNLYSQKRLPFVFMIEGSHKTIPLGPFYSNQKESHSLSINIRVVLVSGKSRKVYLEIIGFPTQIGNYNLYPFVGYPPFTSRLSFIIRPYPSVGKYNFKVVAQTDEKIVGEYYIDVRG